MKKFRRLAVLAGLAGLMAMPAAAADVSYTTVLSGSVVSVAPVGAAVKEGDVLLTVNSLAGPMPAARSDKDGVVKTPAATGVYLAGITRARLIGLLRGDGYDVREASLRIEDLYEADEFFASGNYGKVMPVTRVEGRELQPGPIYARARALYWSYAHA